MEDVFNNTNFNSFGRRGSDVFGSTNFNGFGQRGRDVFGSTNFNNATGRAASVLDSIDPNTFGQIGSLDQLQDFELDRGRVEQNFFDRTSSLLNPQFDQAEQRKIADLRARGIPRDSEAFEREMANFDRSKGETFGRLANDAVLAGGGEQSRQFGLASALGDRPMNAANQLFGMSTNLGQLGLGAQGQQFDQAFNLGAFDLGAQGQQFDQAFNLGAFDLGAQGQQFGQAGQLAQAQSGAQQQLFNMADTIGQREVQAQLQNANIASMNRASQFNELASLLGLQQVAAPGLNNFFTPGNADVTGAHAINQQAQAGNANRAAGMKGGLLGGATDLGSAAIVGK
jgi:hypothetical protein